MPLRNVVASVKDHRGPDRLRVIECFEYVLGKECDALEAVLRRVSLQHGAINQACAILGSCSERAGSNARVVLSGIGKAGLIARKVAATLSSTGTASSFLHPVEALHGDLGFVRSTDPGLFFSYSGETVELVRLAAEMKKLGCSLIAVTRSRESSLASLCTATIELGVVEEACRFGMAPSSSTTVMLAIGDALALTVAHCGDFRVEDFARNHPGGALGLRFRAVASEMRCGARLVCVRPQTSIADVVRRVSDAKTGAAVLTDAQGCLEGIFTDGDLRRSLLQGGQVLEQEVSQFSTIPCHAIRANQSLADALRAFGQTRTEDMPVVDEHQRVVGLLCLKDISVV